MVDRYSNPGKPWPNVPGMGETISDLSGGGPKCCVINSMAALTSLAICSSRAAGSGADGVMPMDTMLSPVPGRRRGNGCDGGTTIISYAVFCLEKKILRFAYTSIVTP